MDFSEQMDNLQKKADDTAAAVKAAVAEDRAQLKQWIEQAQVNVDLAAKEAKQKAEGVADRAESKWAQLKADAAAKMEDMKAKADRRADQMDAKMAATDADWAEADALHAIAFATWTIDNARLAALDAIDARIQADKLATMARS